MATLSSIQAWGIPRTEEVGIITGLPQETRSQRNNLALHLKKLEKEEMKNPRASRRKEILKIRAEINAKEPKETIAKINKAKSWFFEKKLTKLTNH